MTYEDDSPGRPKPSYAALVNSDEGTTLEFMPASCINGVVCAKLEAEDIEDEIFYWQNAVLCCVLGANPPHGVIEGFVRRIWRDRSIDKVAVIKKGLYLVRFTKYHDALQVVQ